MFGTVYIACSGVVELRRLLQLRIVPNNLKPAAQKNNKAKTALLLTANNNTSVHAVTYVTCRLHLTLGIPEKNNGRRTYLEY